MFIDPNNKKESKEKLTVGAFGAATILCFSQVKEGSEFLAASME